MSCRPQLERHIQDPNDVLLYQWDWAKWLAQPPLAGDVIADAEIIAPGLTATLVGHDDTTATARLSGGEICTQYTVTNRITTAGGQVKDWSIYLYLRQQ